MRNKAEVDSERRYMKLGHNTTSVYRLRYTNNIAAFWSQQKTTRTAVTRAMHNVCLLTILEHSPQQTARVDWRRRLARIKTGWAQWSPGTTRWQTGTRRMTATARSNDEWSGNTDDSRQQSSR